MFQDFESIVHEFNNAFGLCFALDILSVLSNEMVYLFITIYALINGDIQLGMQAFVNFSAGFLILYVICDTAHSFASQVRLHCINTYMNHSLYT